MLAESLELMKQSKVKEDFEDIDKKILQVEQTCEKVKVKECEQC